MERDRREVFEIDPVRDLVGRLIRTHYKTVGVIRNVTGPRENGFYSIGYKHPINGLDCWINTITVKDGTVLCEGKPLVILGRVEGAQMSLFDLEDKKRPGEVIL